MGDYCFLSILLMKAAFILFCFLLCLSLVHCQGESILTKLSVYDCYDPDFNNFPDGKIQLFRSGVILPRTDIDFYYEEEGLNFLSYDSKFVGRFDLRMYCIKTNDTDAYAFTGEYNGEAFDKNKNEVHIETVKISPIIAGTINGDGQLKGPVDNIETYTIANGAPLKSLTYYMLKDDVLGCSYPVHPNNQNVRRGCISLNDYNPNVQKSIVSTNCIITEDGDPIQRENCGTPIKIVKTEEIVTSIEETISTQSTATSSIEIGRSFKLNVGVEVDGGAVSGSVEVEAGVTSSFGFTQESSYENARTASTVRTTKVQREYTLDHGRRLKEYKNRKVCTAKGTAFGCFDSECSFSFKLDYKQQTTFLNERAEMSSMVCTTTI